MWEAGLCKQAKLATERECLTKTISSEDSTNLDEMEINGRDINNDGHSADILTGQNSHLSNGRIRRPPNRNEDFLWV
jgi:hypothetical protein